jgi:hypothetical protein
VIIDRIGNYRQHWNDVHPAEEPDILNLAKQQNAQEIKGDHKPKAGNEKLKRNQGHLAGQAGKKDPEQIDKNNNSNGMV